MINSIIFFLYAFLLFFVLSPGVLVYLPSKSNIMITACIHGIIFAIIWSLIMQYTTLHSIKEGNKRCITKDHYKSGSNCNDFCEGSDREFCKSESRKQ